MNHEQIEREGIVDRYVLGHLAPAEAELFEEHYLSCPACLEQIELAEGLRAVAARAAVVEAMAAAEPSPRHDAARPFGARGGGWLLAAALLLAAAIPSYFWWRGSDARPEANALVLSLATVRGGGEPDQQVQLDGETPSLVLSLELEGAGAPRYRAIVRRDGQELWRSDDLRPSAQETLVLTLPATLLQPGDYRVEVAEPAPADRPVASFAFRIVR